VSEIEREQGNPTVDLLDRLAAVLGVAIAEFFVEPPAGGKPPEPCDEADAQSAPSGRDAALAASRSPLLIKNEKAL
jgi:transcriptional regulator with XRE-family HTH domain